MNKINSTDGARLAMAPAVEGKPDSNAAVMKTEEKRLNGVRLTMAPAVEGKPDSSAAVTEGNDDEKRRALKEMANVSISKIPQASIVIDDDEQESKEMVVAAEAELVEDNNMSNNSSRSMYITILVGVLVAVAIILGVTLGLNDDDDDKSSGKPTIILTKEKTLLPTTTSTANETGSEEGGIPVYGLDDIIAFVPETICMDRVPGQGWTALCTPADTIEQGGGSCNVVVRSFLDQVPSADVAIQNSGACRSDIAAGNFTYDDAFLLLPFTNLLLALQMPGDQIALLLEQALNHVMFNNSTGGYPYCAGLRYDVNVTAPFLSRISNVEVNRRFTEDAWRPIEYDTFYTVVANSYLVTDEDSYFALGEVPDELVTDTGKDATEAFVAYAYEQGILLDPPRSEYSTQHFYAPPNFTIPSR
jgi:hypothetical protein